MRVWRGVHARMSASVCAVVWCERTYACVPVCVHVLASAIDDVRHAFEPHFYLCWDVALFFSVTNTIRYPGGER